MNSNQIEEINKSEKTQGDRLGKLKTAFSRLPHSTLIGDLLYLLGFRVEYTLVLMGRRLRKMGKGVASYTANLFLVLLRPVVLGLMAVWEDFTAPFRRHNEEEEEKNVRKGFAAFAWNILLYMMPIGALAAFVAVVGIQMSRHFVLNVQVNGQSVGYVESEQIFDKARDDVQQRIDNAKTIMQASGDSSPDTQWDVQPTFTLAVSNDTMTENEMANAILKASGGDLSDGTAVYADGELLFVTTEGDHLRTYLENVRQQQEQPLESSIHTEFYHDIRLVDGVYLKESIVPYENVISSLNGDGAQATYYHPSEATTVQGIVDATGISFDSLAQMNPWMESLDQEVDADTEVITGASSPELLKIKVIQRVTYTQEIPYETVVTESDDYSFGEKVTTQEGENGSENITQDTTYVDGTEIDTTVVQIDITKQPVTELITQGTKLKNGMTAQVGSGSFVWPVPQYKYVSRWMGNGHKGADICAAYGTPIIASDSGVVVTACYHYSYGNYVVIDHGNGYSTLYAHMSSIAVSVGQSVSQKQVIGYVGSTGNSTGNHCHFEMYKDGVRFSAYELFAGM